MDDQTYIEKRLAAARKLCLPLDGLKIMTEVRAIIEEFSQHVGIFKVGKELFTIFGPEVVRVIHSYGAEVFLDLKYHDIPATVKGAAKAAANMGVYMFNVHASGGLAMMEAAVEGVNEALYENPELRRPKIIAVTILTSIDQNSLNNEVGMSGTVEENVLRLAKNAENACLDGIVCSAQDLEFISNHFDKDFMFVTPGIKLENGKVGADQKRVSTPANAIKNGASILVVGRTITGYDTVEERLDAADAVLDDMLSSM